MHQQRMDVTVSMFEHETAMRAGLDEARPDAVAKQHARGRRTARERIAMLVDRDTFREVGALARPEKLGRDGSVLHGDAIVTGVGDIDGRPAVIASTDFTIAGGSNGQLGNEKLRRCWELAGTRGIPVVMIMDGGGHRLDEGLDARTFGFGFDFQRVLAELSGWVPLVAVIMGPGYGQPTLTAALCDYLVAVRGQAQIGMAPRSVVTAATGEHVEAEALYSADAQARFGTVDLVVGRESEALEAVRCYLATMPANAEAPLPREHGNAPDTRAAQVLNCVVPVDSRSSYDVLEVIAGIVDIDSEVELKQGQAPNMVTMLATIDGMPLGIIANQPAVRAGVLDAGGARKAARLVSLCDAFGIPVLVLMDLPGLAVGTEAESSGLAAAAAALSLELGAATVPAFTVLMRKGYGGAYIVQSGGRTNRPDLVLAWPTAQSGAMAVESAVELMYRKDIAEAPDPAIRRAELIEQYQNDSGALRIAEGFGVDAIVRPEETRAHLKATMRELPRRRLMQNMTPRRHPVRPL